MKPVLIACVVFLATCVCWGESVSFEKDTSITLSQKITLDKFKQRVAQYLTKDYMKTDMYLIRWLRAQNFDMKAAETMLRNAMLWRKENKMDTILDEDWSDVQADFHGTMDTYDKTGRPIGVIDIGDWNIRRAVIQGKAPRVMRYFYFLWESLTTQVIQRQEQGMNVTQWRVLGNADGFNLVEHGCPLCIPYWIQFLTGYENYFPGWMDSFDIINAPSTISVILEVVRPLMSRASSDALHVFGPNKNKWIPFLDQTIDRSERRPQYGGTKPSDI